LNDELLFDKISKWIVAYDLRILLVFILMFASFKITFFVSVTQHEHETQLGNRPNEKDN